MPPRATALLFRYGLPFALGFRFLLGTVPGVFLLSVVLYAGMWVIGDPKPLTFSQLVLWVDLLPTESKTAVVTSVLTVIGFLIAFHTATANWKAEALAHLKVHVAGEIEGFFSEASRRINDAEIYVRSLVDTVNQIQRVGANAETVFKVQRALELAPAFLSTRDRLSAMSIEVHRIAGRHYSVLATVWGATKGLEDCAAAFAEVAKHMWVHVPIIQPHFPDPVGQFVAQVNVTDCTAFLASSERNSDFINGMTGGIRGLLLAPLVGTNLASWYSISRKGSLLVEALTRGLKGRRRDG